MCAICRNCPRGVVRPGTLIFSDGRVCQKRARERCNSQSEVRWGRFCRCCCFNSMLTSHAAAAAIPPCLFRCPLRAYTHTRTRPALYGDTPTRSTRRRGPGHVGTIWRARAPARSLAGSLRKCAHTPAKTKRKVREINIPKVIERVGGRREDERRTKTG